MDAATLDTKLALDPPAPLARDARFWTNRSGNVTIDTSKDPQDERSFPGNAIMADTASFVPVCNEFANAVMARSTTTAS